MSSFARRKDENQGEHETFFKERGWEIVDTYRAANGFTDFVISRDDLYEMGSSEWKRWLELGRSLFSPERLAPFSSINVLIESKTEEGSLTDSQRKFHARWKGPVEIVTTQEDCQRVHHKYTGR